MQTIADGSGLFDVPNPAFRFGRSAAHARNSVPVLGADGPAVLRSLGLTGAAIEALRTQGIVHVPPAAAEH